MMKFVLSTTESILRNLNDQQKEAVTHRDGPLLVLAGAGSGKTRALTHRIAYLIAEGITLPENILAITFTNKAASEMKERIVALVGPSADRMWIGTFHHTCVRVLRREAEKLGYRRSFVIYDGDDSERLVKLCLRELEFDPKRFHPVAVRDAISKLKDELIDTDTFASRALSPFESVVAQTYKLYQQKLFSNNAMDFDDLIMNTTALFELYPGVLDFYQEIFKHILVDEYQDTNRAQYMFVRLLSMKYENLSVVGDDDQSIYGWRGADIRNILEFEHDYTGTKIIKLEQNYRSTQTILDAANSIIGHNESRKPKVLWTSKENGEKIKLFRATDEFEEARFIASEIARMSSENSLKLSDFAVFYRIHAQSRVLEEAFMKFGIPYRIVGGPRFYERAEIKDVIAYLRAIDNPNDDLSLTRIINSPTRGVGSRTIEKLRNYSFLHKKSLMDSIATANDVPDISAKTAKKLEELHSQFERWRNEADELGIVKLIEKVLEESDYLNNLREAKSIEALGRLENIEEFLVSASEFEARMPGAMLNDFLENVSLIADVDKLEKPLDTATLLTLHNAKGLEFTAVFIAGVEEGVFPHHRSVRERDLEEERRLCYVGLTRAKERLYLSYSSTRTIYGGRRYNIPSRFLREIPAELLSSLEGVEVEEPISIPFDVGEMVEHPTFGVGRVTEIETTGVLTVDFEDGKKRQLHMEYAPLSKLASLER